MNVHSTRLVPKNMEWAIGPFSFSVPPADAWAFYLYMVIVGFVIRYFLVMRPTLSLIQKYNPEVRNIIRAIFSIKNVFGLKGIESFLVRESFTLILPGLAALVIRLSLGNPQGVEWNDTRMYLMGGFAFLWIIAEFDQTLSEIHSAWESVDIYSAAQAIKSFGTGVFPSHWLELSKTRLYDGNHSASWALHRIVRDLLSVFSPICPFFTHYLSTTLYGNSAVDVDSFPELTHAFNREKLEQLLSLTDELESFNSMVWKAKKESGVSLKSSIAGIDIPESLSIFSNTLVQMHSLE